MIQIQKTSQIEKPRLVLAIYGVGKSGKTTLSTTAPKPIILDAENGVKGLFTAGIDVPFVQIRTWQEVMDCYSMLKENKEYETIVIDPLGNFMDMLIEYVAGTEGMSLQKWGKAKDIFKKFVKSWNFSGKHVIFVAHDTLTEDDRSQLRSVKVPGNLSEDFHNMMDVIGYYSVEANGERKLLLQPTTKIKAGTRYKVFPPTITNPNVTEMIAMIHKTWAPQAETAKK